MLLALYRLELGKDESVIRLFPLLTDGGVGTVVPLLFFIAGCCCWNANGFFSWILARALDISCTEKALLEQPKHLHFDPQVIDAAKH